MITFKINGQEIDMRKDVNISLSYDNPIFGFDNIKLSRTQNFKIPKTPTNNKIFGFAGRPDVYGSGMRINYSAVMYYPAGNVDGLLYISDTEKSNYNAVFVFGELTALKAVTEAGNIEDYGDFTGVTTNWGDVPTAEGTGAALTNFGLKPYHVLNLGSLGLKSGWNYMPTAKWQYIMDTCASAFALTIDYTGISDYVSNLGIKVNKYFDNAGGYSTGTVTRIYNAGSTPPENIVIGTSVSTFLTTTYVNPPNSGDVVCLALQLTTGFYGTFQPINNVKRYRISVIRNGVIIREATAYSSGSPLQLNGKFNAGDIIVVDDADLDSGSDELFNKYVNISYTMTIRVRTQPPTEIPYPRNSTIQYPLQTNLPDITLTDMIKTTAYLTGRGIVPNGKDGISFYDYSFTNNGMIVDDKLISIDRVKRGVGNYGQRSFVNFNSGPSVSLITDITQEYIIDNQGIEQEVNLYTIPLSEGGTQSTFGSTTTLTGLVDIIGERDDDGVYTYTFGNDSDTIVYREPGTVNLTRPNFMQNPNLDRIFELSTAIDVKIAMYQYEFMQIKHDTVFRLQNNRWCVYSGRWQKNVASLVLQKIE